MKTPTTYLPDTHRALPVSIDAEKGVLCSILLSPDEVLNEALQRGVSSDYFHLPSHRVIYDAIGAIRAAASQLDFITLTQFLRDRKQLEAVGGAAAITDLGTFVATPANAAYYLEILREKYLLRRVITVCTEYTARAYEEQSEVTALLDGVEADVLRIGDDRFNAKTPEMKTLVLSAIDNIERRLSRSGTITGLATGISGIDELTDGIKGAEMIVIAARPSMGKTALGLNIAVNVALGSDKQTPRPVAFYSLEMSTQQLVEQMIGAVSRVNIGRRGASRQLGKNDADRILAAADKLGVASIYIDDTPGLSIMELRAHARRLQQRQGVELIVIDYLQLLRSTTRRAMDNRQIEVSEISAGLKGLAKELNIPVVVLAQLNRNPELRAGTGKSEGGKARPRLSDLRESGSIEQDADVVGLLYREDYYATDEEERQELEGRATLIVAKQRNGPVGDIPLTFIKEIGRFEDRARDYETTDEHR